MFLTMILACDPLPSMHWYDIIMTYARAGLGVGLGVGLESVVWGACAGNLMPYSCYFSPPPQLTLHIQGTDLPTSVYSKVRLSSFLQHPVWGWWVWLQHPVWWWWVWHASF